MHIVHVNCFCDDDLDEPDELRRRHHTLVSWCDALRDQGVERVTVVQRFRRDGHSEHAGIQYVLIGDHTRGRLPSRRWSRRAAAVVAAQQASIVHVHGLWYAATAALLKAHVGRTPVLLQHHAEAPPRHPWRRWRLSRDLARVDGVLFTSAPQAAPWRRASWLGHRLQVFEVPESGAQVDVLPPACARAASGITGAPAIVWVGRLNDNKDPLTVLDGFGRIRARLPRATLTFVHGGPGERLPELRQRLERDPALAAAVRLRGTLPHREVFAVLAAADLFVLGSHREGSGYALIEAMGCGAIPVVTDIPAFRKLTGDGVDGVLWPTGDAEACGRAMLAAASLDRETWRRRVRARFDAQLSWGAVARRALEVYREVIGPPAPRT